MKNFSVLTSRVKARSKTQNHQIKLKKLGEKTVTEIFMEILQNLAKKFENSEKEKIPWKIATVGNEVERVK